MGTKLVNNIVKFTTERHRIFYINFRRSTSTIFRMSLNTDSLRQCEVTMARLMPYIPLVQSDVMDVEEFTDHVKGINKLTKTDLGEHSSPEEMETLKSYLYKLPQSDWRKTYFLPVAYTGIRRSEIKAIFKKLIKLDMKTERYANKVGLVGVDPKFEDKREL